MAFANFEEFCKGFCAVGGIHPPELIPDEFGALAFTVRMRGVDVTMLEIGCVRADVAYLIAEFGAFPPRHEALEHCRRVMDANSRIVAERCAFSRNPDTGELILQRAVPLAAPATTSTSVYEDVCEMVDAALQWFDLTLPEGEEWPFICTKGPGASARRLEYRHVNDPAAELDTLEEALEANFALMTDADGAAFGRDPATGAVVKWCAGPLSTTLAAAAGILPLEKLGDRA